MIQIASQALMQIYLGGLTDWGAGWDWRGNEM